MTAEAAREYLLAEHSDDLRRVLDCADAVAAGFDGEATADPDDVSAPLRATLDRAGLLERFPAMLAGAADAAGLSLPARPVAAPPYVAVTSVGPVLRATGDAGRLVVTVAAFAVRGDPTRYARAAETPEDALAVEMR